MTSIVTAAFAEELKSGFEAEGYAVAHSLFSAEEVTAYRDHFMKLRLAGAYPFDLAAQSEVEGDPLLRFPRMAHMHRWDDLTRNWLLDDRINTCLSALLGAEPYAVQSMLYFKPPLARGQALHQDNFYLHAKPGTCCAAWLALDDCDEENGCMQVVPGSHRWPLLCTEAADPDISFTDVSVPLPPGTQTVPVLMKAGDVLFFGGSLIHGSLPNKSESRFRRSLIGHYVEGRAEELTTFDQPVLRMDGEELMLGAAVGGGPCGMWSEGEFEMVVAGA